MYVRVCAWLHVLEEIYVILFSYQLPNQHYCELQLMCSLESETKSICVYFLNNIHVHSFHYVKGGKYKLYFYYDVCLNIRRHVQQWSLHNYCVTSKLLTLLYPLHMCRVCSVHVCIDEGYSTLQVFQLLELDDITAMPLTRGGSLKWL